MFKNRRTFLLHTLIIFNLFSSINSILKLPKDAPVDFIIERMLEILLNKCNLGFKNIIFSDYTNNTSILEVFPKLDNPVAVYIQSIFSDDNRIDSEIDGIILAFDSEVPWKDLSFSLAYMWGWNKDYTLIIMTNPFNNCWNTKEFFNVFRSVYISKAYYICINNAGNYIVLTHDYYGNTEPLNWQAHLRYNYDDDWTLYSRIFKSEKVCKGFSFSRTNLTVHPKVMLAVKPIFFKKFSEVELYKVYNLTSVRHQLTDNSLQNIGELEALLKMKFNIYIGPEEDHLANVYHNTFADLTLEQFTPLIYNYWEHSFPMQFDSYSILSRSRGLRTPLEKITKFYGTCTLVSLLVILVITFFVIWFKANKSTSKAFFDIIRLLQNSGVYIPIDTLSMKIFFTMIFLYFLVLHATFSGHLAEFLTKSESKKNVESIKDLKDSRIDHIYSSGFLYEDEDRTELNKKTSLIGNMHYCSPKVKYEPKSACISFLSLQEKFICKGIPSKSISQFYLKELLDYSSYISMLYRRRFPLIEKFNVALIYLSETMILNHLVHVNITNCRMTLLQHSLKSVIVYRAITLSDLKFAFVFLIVGNCLGFICFFAEICICRNRYCFVKLGQIAEITIIVKRLWKNKKK